jgi:hypothetical protein
MLARFLRWAFRPAVLIAVSVVLVGVAAIVVFQPEQGQSKPQPAAVAPDEREIAFLYPATNNTFWERFVAAVHRSREPLGRLSPGLEVLRDTSPDREQAVPEVVLRWPGSPGKLVFRWYKLTSDWSPEAWVDALLARQPPPLAIIGGSSSYWGRELAIQLARAGESLPKAERPLLLLTTATANRVEAPGTPHNGDIEDFNEDNTVDLSSLYPGRTFRFCFTNRQMAIAVTRFIWSRPELRPDSDPAFIAQWTDDSYSRDLFKGYGGFRARTGDPPTIHEHPGALDYRASDNLMQQWGFVSGCIGLGAHPATLAGWVTSAFRHEGNFPLLIDSSIGTFASPNPYEARAAQDLLKRLENGGPRRPLLVVTGQTQASRRFLRDLGRSAPETARRFVVALGDAVSFNTIYRDRLVTWPIQDLPFETVLFCHRNPIDARAGFRQRQPRDRAREAVAEKPDSTNSSSGTDDLLLFGDVVEAVGLAFVRNGTACANAGQLAEGLLAVHLFQGELSLEPRGLPLFRADGQRTSATGEHVVYLRPQWKGDLVLPEAIIEVWFRKPVQGNINIWEPYGEPLRVSYDESRVPGE